VSLSFTGAGEVTNNAAATIQSAEDVVLTFSNTGEVTNAGTVTAGAKLTAAYTGVGSLNNSGSVTTGGDTSLTFSNDGTVSNSGSFASGAKLTAGFTGIGQLTNTATGTLSSAGDFQVTYAAATSTFNNQNVLNSGGNFDVGYSLGGTFTNAGTITDSKVSGLVNIHSDQALSVTGGGTITRDGSLSTPNVPMI
jgi:hypothetical protein